MIFTEHPTVSDCLRAAGYDTRPHSAHRLEVFRQDTGRVVGILDMFEAVDLVKGGEEAIAHLRSRMDPPEPAFVDVELIRSLAKQVDGYAAFEFRIRKLLRFAEVHRHNPAFVARHMREWESWYRQQFACFDRNPDDPSFSDCTAFGFNAVISVLGRMAEAAMSRRERRAAA